MVGGRKGNGNTGMKAHSAAVARLKEAHPEEFDGYLREERVNRGLPATPTGHKMTTEQKIEKLQARINELRATQG